MRDVSPACIFAKASGCCEHRRGPTFVYKVDAFLYAASKLRLERLEILGFQLIEPAQGKILLQSNVHGLVTLKGDGTMAAVLYLMHTCVPELRFVERASTVKRPCRGPKCERQTGATVGQQERLGFPEQGLLSRFKSCCSSPLHHCGPGALATQRTAALSGVTLHRHTPPLACPRAPADMTLQILLPQKPSTRSLSPFQPARTAAGCSGCPGQAQLQATMGSVGGCRRL